MIAGMASAFSAIQAGARMLSIGAHNIANAQTEGFKRTRAIPVESSAGAGVTVTLQKDERPGHQLLFSQDALRLREGSNVDLDEEIISNLQTVNLLEANIASVRIQDQV